MKAISATLADDLREPASGPSEPAVLRIRGRALHAQAERQDLLVRKPADSAGAPLKQRYLGPDTDEMRMRIEEMQSATPKPSRLSHLRILPCRTTPRRRDRRDQIARPAPCCARWQTAASSDLGGTLVGTHAFRHYDLTLGVHLSDESGGSRKPTTSTSPASRSSRWPSRIRPTLILPRNSRSLGFKPAPYDHPQTLTSWMLPDASYAIDFPDPVIPRRGRACPNLPALKMWAQSLHFLNFLIADPIDAVSPYMEGLLVKIPRPERYAVHKLIISQRRKECEARKAAQRYRAGSRNHLGDGGGSAIRDSQRPSRTQMRSGEQWRKALDQALDVADLAGQSRFESGDFV